MTDWTPTAPGYVSTPELPDDEGKALLEQLDDLLYFATERDPETGKKVRSGSSDERYALAQLKAAMIMAGARFARHANFRAWLGENYRYHHEGNDPVFLHWEMSIAPMRAAGSPALCSNPDCSDELLTTPEVRAFLKTSDDPHAQSIGMGACEACAAKGDDALLAMARKHFARYGLQGAPPEDSAMVRVDLENCGTFTAGGVEILVACRDGDDNPICDVADVLGILLRNHMLPRFAALRHGAGNCHSIADQLYLDIKNLGIGLERRFSVKHGSSALLKTTTTPDGLHSRVESDDGWSIDGSNGALGRPVTVLPAAELCQILQLTDVHDVTPALETLEPQTQE